MRSEDLSSDGEPDDVPSGDEAVDTVDLSETSDPCVREPLPFDDPRHLYTFVRIDALQPGLELDSVRVLPGGVEACALLAESVEYASFEDVSATLPQLLGEPDGVPVEAASCDGSLAALVPQTGDSVVVGFRAPVLELDVIEVREVTACANATPVPQFRISLLPGPVELEQALEVGDGAGPISRLTVPVGFYGAP